MLTYAHLRNPLDTHRGAFLLCEDCGYQSTVELSDYWREPDSAPVRCPYCETPVVLAALRIEVLAK